MSTSIQIAVVRDTILETAELDLVVSKNGTDHIGTLFFEKDFSNEVVTVLGERITDDEGVQLVLDCYELMREYGIVKYETTLKTMLHWAYMNGVSDEIFDSYNYEKDEQILAAIA